MHINNCSIVPAKSEHAVQAAVFVCELPALLSIEAIRKVISHYETSTELQKLFPKKAESRSVSISVGAGGIGVQNNENITGVNFERIDANSNVELALSFNGSAITYVCNSYTRWNIVFKDAISILEQFIKFVIPEPGISVIGLQYIDEFFVSGNLKNFTPSMIFSEHGSLLPANVLGQSEGWHSHSGWFDVGQDGEKILNNLNINTVIQPERMVVQIISAHRNILLQPIIDVGVASTALSDSYGKLHLKNKNLFAQLLNAQMKREIHLETTS